MDVLMVDDEPGFLEQAKIFLERTEEDLSVETTTSVEEVLSLLKEGEFDAIVSDYRMAPMDGLELLRAVEKEVDHLPFVMLTGRGDEEVAMEALNLGADRYIQKGGDPKNQFSRLARTLVELAEERRSTEVLYGKGGNIVRRETATWRKITSEESVSVSKVAYEALVRLQEKMRRDGFFDPQLSDAIGWLKRNELKGST